MDHRDHVNLLRQAIPDRGGIWADLGSGEGAFTLALRDLIGVAGEIFSIDREQRRLAVQQRTFRERFPDSNIQFRHADFARPLNLPPLDGIVMANSLHFFRDKAAILRHAREYLKEGGRLVLVEYNVDTGNLWVPHPLSFETFRALAPRLGFTEPQLLSTVPSRFLREIYSALAFKKT
jgi:ubiquinone/menaquinone biosynthesis C-methylase UbiE